MADDRLEQVLTDLDTLGDQLAAALEGRPEDDWRTPTPAEGWDVAATIAHLAWTDEAAVLAARAHRDGPGEDGKAAWDALVLEAMGDPDGFVDAAALGGGAAAPSELVDRWRTSRRELAEALRAVPDGVKLPWFGPPMSPTSMATARCMETWAHAQDVYDALGVDADPTPGLRQVCHLGVRTRGFSFANAGRPVPEREVRVELTAPDGSTWTWGPGSPQDAADRVTGPALDFALLVTQRRHRADLALTAVGEAADAWLDLAQAFAGPPGGGREPRS
ncbi:TIGR03084 family protein [Nocardioidaceae bacterium]|nr:TIGR03084 family protein [Nocardioidaceae bacterium]